MSEILDYNEILLQAVDTLIAKRLENLPFDKTIICTITDDSHKDEGAYTVTDGTVTFDAQAENKTYYKEEKVQVLIPNGDMSLQKTIIGRHSSDMDANPIAYVAPSEKVAQLTDNLFTSGQNRFGIAAGQVNSAVTLITGTPVKIDVNIYDTVCIKADFECFLQDKDMRQGTYGIAVRLTNAEGDTLVLHLDSATDMFGRPYAYTMPSAQQQAHKIDQSFGVITYIEAFLYQSGDFRFWNGEVEEEIDSIEDNIFASNIQIYFGTDVSQVEDNTVKIFTNDSTRYTLESLEKNLRLVWYNKDSDNKLLGFKDGVIASSENEIAYAIGAESIPEGDNNKYYYIRWYVDNQDGSLTEVEGAHGETVTITCRKGLTYTEVQARVYLNGAIYTSNTIQFTNNAINQEAIARLDIKLNINKGTNSQDAYPFYGEDNKLVNISEKSKIRELNVSWESGNNIINEEYFDGAIVTWMIPVNSTMLLPVESISSVAIENNFYCFLGNFDSPFKYRIKEVFNASYIQNIIKCRVAWPEGHEKSGIVIEGIKSFIFTSQGTFGTDYTLVVRPKDTTWLFGFGPGANENTILDTSAFEGLLYDIDGNKIDADVTLSIYGDIKDKISFSPGEYNVIQATTNQQWAGRSVALSTLYPVIYSKGNKYYGQVPIKVIYDSAGKLMNLNSVGAPLKLFSRDDNTEITDIDWRLGEANFAEAPDSYRLYIRNGSISFPQLYMQNKVRTVIKALKNNELLWSSPIIIQQYKYDSEVLNNWDGKLQINNEGNYVLAAAASFGKMETDNTFSGVIIGDIGTIDNNITDVGILGYRKGAQAFGLKNDGSFFIKGKNNTGVFLDNLGNLIMNLNSMDLTFSDATGDNKTIHSFIKASADAITSTVVQTANYYCTCSTDDSTYPNNKYIKLNNDDYTALLKQKKLSNGCTFSINFKYKHIKNTDTLYFHLCNLNAANQILQIEVANSSEIEWEDGDTLIFTYSDEKLHLTTVSSSKIVQTESSIKASVSENYVNKLGKNSTNTFGWNLTSDGFYIGQTNNPTWDNSVLAINSNGLKIKGNIIMEGGSISWGNVNAPGIGNIPNLSKNLQDINDIADEALNTANGAAKSSDLSALDSAVARHLGITGTTVVTNKAVISPYIGGGYLYLTGGNNSIIINPGKVGNDSNAKHVFQIKKGSDLVMGLDDNGNAIFKGHVEAGSGSFKGHIEASSGKIGGWGIYNTNFLGCAFSSDENNSKPPFYGIGIDGTKDTFMNNNKVFAIGQLGTLNTPNVTSAITQTWENAAFYVTGKGDVKIGGNLTISGITTLGGNLTISGTTTLGGNLTIKSNNTDIFRIDASYNYGRMGGWYFTYDKMWSENNTYSNFEGITYELLSNGIKMTIPGNDPVFKHWYEIIYR